MLSKVIGIISYFPENEDIKLRRFNKLDTLIATCNRLFNLPILIIAQNYKESDIWYFKNKYNNILIDDNVSKLGITGARKRLRSLFLDSGYDYLIMLDDDIRVEGKNGEEYLKQIDANPDCFIENNKSRLQLFAISKYIFSQHDFNDIEAERGEAFEDRVFFYTLCKKFSDRHKKFINTGITEHAVATGDKDSTWYRDQDLKQMNETTLKLIDELAKS